MKIRSLTAVFIFIFYALVVYLTIYVHKIFFDIFVLMLMVSAGFEMSRAISKKFSKPLELFVLLNCLAGYIAFYLCHDVLNVGNGIAMYFAVTGLVFILSAVYSMFSKKATMRNVVSTMLVIVYPVTLLVYMLGLNYLPYSASSNMNVAAILLIFVISTLTDTFAYLVGVTVKGPKLCPSISPKKTISGAVGGLLGGLIGAGILLLFSYQNWLHVPMLSDSSALNIVHYLVIGLVGSVFTQLGDMIASYIKRQCEIKDFSNLLPGHGGIMDRIDGIMLNAVFVYVYFLALSF